MTHMMCTRCGKRGYGSLRRAVHAAIFASRQFEKPMRYYKCPWKSKLWHITSKEKVARCG